MHLNLLPIRFRVRLIVRAQLRNWSKLWGLCLLMSVALCGVQLWQVHDARNQLERVNVKSRPVREIGLQTVKLSQQLSRLESEAERTETILPEDRSLSLLGILGDSVAQTTGRIQIVRLTVHTVGRSAGPTNPSRKQAAKASTSAPRPSTVSIQGVAVDDESLSHFVTALRGYHVFDRVDLRSTNRLAAAVNGGGREFQLECCFQ